MLGINTQIHKFHFIRQSNYQRATLSEINKISRRHWESLNCDVLRIFPCRWRANKSPLVCTEWNPNQLNAGFIQIQWGCLQQNPKWPDEPLREGKKHLQKHPVKTHNSTPLNQIKPMIKYLKTSFFSGLGNYIRIQATSEHFSVPLPLWYPPQQCPTLRFRPGLHIEATCEKLSFGKAGNKWENAQEVGNKRNWSSLMQCY